MALKPDILTASAQRLDSAWEKRAISSGVEGMGSKPTGVHLSRISVLRSARVNSAFRRAMMASGVPAGAAMEGQM